MQNIFFQKKCVVASPYYYKVIPAMGYVTIELEVTDCPGIAVIEHVRWFSHLFFQVSIAVFLNRCAVISFQVCRQMFWVLFILGTIGYINWIFWFKFAEWTLFKLF